MDWHRDLFFEMWNALVVLVLFLALAFFRFGVLAECIGVDRRKRKKKKRRESLRRGERDAMRPESV